MNWDDFTVVVTQGSAPKQMGWNAPPQVFPAETCARHVYLGLHQDFKNVPLSLMRHKETTIYRGVDAYSFIVEWFVGFKNNRYLSDHNVSGQIRKGWQRYCGTHPDDHRNLQPYIDAIFADGKVLKSNLPSFVWQQPTIASTAVREAGLTKNSKVLVVCEAGALSEEVIRALGYRKINTPDEITLTHPDMRALGEITRVVKSRPGHKAIKAELRPLSFSRAMRDLGNNETTIFNADAVFVCVPMGAEKYASVDQELRDMWRLRGLVTQNGAKLFHVKGNPQMRGQTTEDWQIVDPPITDYISLKETSMRRIAAAQEVIQQTRYAIKHMAELRGQGRRAIKVEFNMAEGMGTPSFVESRRPERAYQPFIKRRSLAQ